MVNLKRDNITHIERMKENFNVFNYIVKERRNNEECRKKLFKKCEC